MRCGFLGPLEVRGDGGALISVAGAKERRLLAALATACPAVVSVDRLYDLVWDGEPPATARKSLQAHVVRLRSALEPDRPHGSPGRYVVRRQAGYALALERDELDCLRFVDLSARGRALLSSGNAEEARNALGEALDLWRGEPYADWPDALFAEAERQRLEGVWTNVTESLWEAELALGNHTEAIPELERMAGEHPLHENWWSLLAVALYRSGRQGDAMDAVRRARSVLAEELGADPGPRLRAVEHAVLVQDPELDLGDRPHQNGLEIPPQRSRAKGRVEHCPYKGLSAYQVEDAALFYGRERLVGALVRSLVDSSLLVVSGSSGAGKSSVVRAGLLPALASGAVLGSEEWEHLVVTPGASAVDALSSLTSESGPGTPTVLVCDQLEQLWSATTAPAERAAFLDNVLGLIADEAVVRCVLVVRGDHVGRMAEHGDMAERMVGSLVLVPPLSEPELREVVEKPATAAGLHVEPELTDIAVQEVLGRAGALPLLSTALTGTWERRRGDTLTLAGYLASGGVAGAVARSAEDVYAAFDERGQEIARRVLVRLADQADPHDAGSLQRRRMSLHELALTGANAATQHAVVEALVERRLLALDGDHLEVAHEALLTAWPRLARWLEDDAAGRAVRRHVAPAAQEWQSHGRPVEELYRGARLDAAAQWASQPDSDATPLEREFIGAGVTKGESELEAARDRANAEAVGRRRTQRLAIGLTAALVLALLAVGFAVRYQRSANSRATDARTARTVADANRLAALSTTARSLDLSLLLAAAAVRTADTPATRDGLLNALAGHRRATGVFQVGEQGVTETAMSADGRTMFVTQGGGSPRVVSWRTGSSRPPRSIDDWWPDHIAVSPDGRVLVATGNNFRDGLWAYTRDGRTLRVLNGEKALGGSPRDVAFTRDGRLLLLVGRFVDESSGYSATVKELDLDDGTVRPVRSLGTTDDPEAWPDAAFSDDASAVLVWPIHQRTATRLDLDTGKVTHLAVDRRAATSLEFVALPHGAVQTWSDGVMTRYNAAGRAVQVLDVHRAPVRDVAVLPGGRGAATAGDDGEVRLWDIEVETGMWSQREGLVGHSGNVEQIEVAGGGRTLLTTSGDGQQISWDLTGDAGFGSTYRGLDDRWVASRVGVVVPGELVVAPTRLASNSPREMPSRPGEDTVSVAATFLDPRTGRVVDQVVVGDTLAGPIEGSSVAVSPDARLVAVTSVLGTTVLDTRTREVLTRIKLPRTDSTPPDYPATLVWCAAWSADGSRLLLGYQSTDEEREGGIAVVATSTWKVVDRVDLRGSPAVMEWNRDKSRLAVSTNFQGKIMLLDPALQVRRTIKLADDAEAWDLSFSPNGKLLAASGTNGKVSVLDTSTWRPVHEPAAMHNAPVLDVEWLPDSNTVLTAGLDEMVSMYDVERDLVRARPLPASEQTGDGHTFLLPGSSDELVVLNIDGPGHRYPLDPARWLAQACRIAGRDLTQEEWDRYVPNHPYKSVCDLG